MEQITVNTHEVGVKEYFGQRVVTFADVDAVHEKPKGSAKDRFYKNKKRFKLGEDYFVIKPQDLTEAQKYMSHTSETEKNEIRSFEGPSVVGIDYVNPRGLTLLTESGYLLLVKVFDDDLAWEVQRKLVKTYFTVKQFKISKDTYDSIIERIETLEKENRPPVSAFTEANMPYFEEIIEHFKNSDSSILRDIYRDVDHVADFIINMMGRDVYEQALREYKITYHCGAPRKRYKVIEMMPEYHFRYQCALAHKINDIRMEAFK